MLSFTGCSSAQQGNTKTEKFKLIDGWQSMEYKYMEFINSKGDSIYAAEFDTCLTPTGYVSVWDSARPPIKLLPKYLNQKFKITYIKDIVQGPYSDGRMIYGMVIKKMELLK